MALQFSTAYRNAMLDAFATTAGNSEVIKIFTGSVPANCAAADIGTKLAEDDLPFSSWNAASGGTKSLAGLPMTVVAVAAGTAGYYRIYNTGATICHNQGTVTGTGGGGDATVDNTTFVAGENVVIFTLQFTAPGA